MEILTGKRQSSRLLRNGFFQCLFVDSLVGTPEAPTENHGLFTHKVRDNGRPKAEHTEGVCKKKEGGELSDKLVYTRTEKDHLRDGG